MLSLVANDPLDLRTLGSLLSDKDELFLVWPEAAFPFDPEQWREKLLSRSGNRSYFVAHNDAIIGHAALLETDAPRELALGYLFIRPGQRGRGFGRTLMALLEEEAKKVPGIQALRLRARTYNLRAVHLYQACGFVTEARDGTLMIMRKALATR